MKAIIRYIQRYFYDVDKRVLTAITCLTALLIFLNYFYHIDEIIRNRHSFWFSVTNRFSIYLLAFAIPYGIVYILRKADHSFPAPLIFFLLLAPAMFAFKISPITSMEFSVDKNWNSYFNHLLYWPIRLMATGCILFIVWKWFDNDQPFYGTTIKKMDWKPYFLMLLIMIPLIAAASTQPDFQETYPKWRTAINNDMNSNHFIWQALLFEFSYGTDFISIELFFRGFLVLAFVKWVGKDAILPMACFYCAIHFGKPLGECISAYFGGLILGIVVFHTRSIWGGLIVHLGIAWMMELGGYLGNSMK